MATADRLMERGRAKEAVKIYEKALAEQPDGVEALNGLAYAYLDTEHFNAAVDTFRRVLAAVPNNGNAMIGLAETYKLRGDKGKAVEWYEKYLAELPGGSKAAMARQNIDELKAGASSHPVRATATEVHDAPPLPSPTPPAPAP